MSNPTLTEADRSLLVALESDAATLDGFADRVDPPPDRIGDRLAVLADNGLVRVVGDEYRLTDDGRRLLQSPGDGSADNAIDAPESVVAALEDAGMRADRFDAVLGAFAFLQFWGEATAAEIRDGAFSEEPLDFESADAWWSEFVRDHLAGLPCVEASDADGGFWRFTGTPGVAGVSDDGRKVVFGRSTDRPRRYASATEAMVEMGLTEDQRLAVAAALAVLQRTDAADSAALREAAAGAGRRTRAATDVDADASAEWLDSTLFAVLERLPGVVRTGNRWRYTLGPDGYAPA